MKSNLVPFETSSSTSSVCVMQWGKILYKSSTRGSCCTCHSYMNLMFFRFRTVPTFGRGTIRRFVDNVSELKKLAARDYEDLLQVCSTFYPHFECSLKWSSVHQLASKDSSPPGLKRLMTLFKTCLLIWPPGMLTPSCASTLT